MYGFSSNLQNRRSFVKTIPMRGKTPILTSELKSPTATTNPQIEILHYLA